MSTRGGAGGGEDEFKTEPMVDSHLLILKDQEIGYTGTRMQKKPHPLA